jgi:hypothetical protein
MLPGYSKIVYQKQNNPQKISIKSKIIINFSLTPPIFYCILQIICVYSPLISKRSLNR